MISPSGSYAEGCTVTVSVSLDTKTDTVAGVGFILTPTSGLTFNVPTQGTFKVGPNFNCQIISGKLQCSISGTNGIKGKGEVVSVPATLGATATGDITLTLSGLSASDDLGDAFMVSPASPVTPAIPASTALCRYFTLL